MIFMNVKDKNILITGATGFIGKYLAKKLIEDNRVFCITRTKNEVYKNNNIEWILCDLSKRIDFKDFPKDIDIIIHLAQSRKYKQFPDEALDIFSVNTYSTLQLLDYGRRIGIERFVYASTGGVYTPRNDERLRETEYINPINFYALSKYTSEQLAKFYTNYFDTVILRYFFVYGPGQKGMLIPNLIESVKTGKPIVIYNENGIRITPIYIDDAVEATIRALKVSGYEIINIGGKDIVSIKEIAEIIGNILRKKPVYEFKIDPNARDYIADITKMKELLKYTPKVSIEEGLKKTIHESATLSN
jgi:nucleoside-diphosphate-sugar epimerase